MAISLVVAYNETPIIYYFSVFEYSTAIVEPSTIRLLLIIRDSGAIRQQSRRFVTWQEIKMDSHQSSTTSHAGRSLQKYIFGEWKNAVRLTGMFLGLNLTETNFEVLVWHWVVPLPLFFSPYRNITEEFIDDYEEVEDAPEVDLFFRTSGECRLSDFLLWQSGYSCIHFTPKMFPEIGAWDIFKAVMSHLASFKSLKVFSRTLIFCRNVRSFVAIARLPC